MSALFVPGCIRRFAFALNMVCSISCVSWSSSLEPNPGDLGPSWISAGGGGLGRRGDIAAILTIEARSGWFRIYGY